MLINDWAIQIIYIDLYLINLSSIKELSDLNKAKSVATYDFSTLYTKIPHTELISVLDEITDFCFNGCSDSKLWINNGTARWCHTPKKESNLKKRLVGKEMVKKEIAFLLGNCYFKVGKNVFKQVIGIPMGTDPAPFMANLFLYNYENKFIKELKKTDRLAARKFGNIWRYIDDLSAVNDDKMFENISTWTWTKKGEHWLLECIISGHRHSNH